MAAFPVAAALRWIRPLLCPGPPRRRCAQTKMQINSAVLPFWLSVPLGPFHKKKNIRYLVLTPTLSLRSLVEPQVADRCRQACGEDPEAIDTLEPMLGTARAVVRARHGGPTAIRGSGNGQTNGGGGVPSRLKWCAGWYFRVYLLGRLLRRESPTPGLGGGGA